MVLVRRRINQTVVRNNVKKQISQIQEKPDSIKTDEAESAKKSDENDDNYKLN